MGWPLRPPLVIVQPLGDRWQACCVDYPGLTVLADTPTEAHALMADEVRARIHISRIV